MTPFVQFDPATLAIWTNSGLLLEPTASQTAAAMRAAALGKDPAKATSGLAANDALRSRILWLASCVWHEKRHFFDTCLTNYGARRFRDLFTLAYNLSPILADAQHRGHPIWFPVEAYGNEVRRDVLGIPEPPPNILKIARLARQIKSFTKQLDAPMEYLGNQIQIGGEAQLEGLAQVSQAHAIEYHFGDDDAIAITAEQFNSLSRKSAYRVIESVCLALGCWSKFKRRINVAPDRPAIALNPGLASALFFTALCGRFFGAGPEPCADLVLPSARFGRLIQELGEKPGRFDMSDEEAFWLVDSAAKRLWGRTALEEIAADIDASEAKLERPAWVDEGLVDAWADFISLRRTLLARAQALGSASLLPRAFPEHWLDKLMPWHVVATPDSRPIIEEAEKKNVVFGREFNPPPEYQGILPRSVTWARLDTPQDAPKAETFAVRDRGAWLTMLEQHGPRAHLMLNGRNHRRMVPPELERAIYEIQESGIPARFDPRFEWPESRDSAICAAEAEEYAAFSHRTCFHCDITGDKIAPTEAAILTAWEIRRSPLVQRVREAGFFGEYLLGTNWDDWVVRRDLLA